MAAILYLLCTATALVCCVLLFRGYHRTRFRLLLWSSFCFAGLALNNTLLFVDKIVLPQHDLSIARGLVALISLLLLIYGLIWDSD